MLQLGIKGFNRGGAHLLNHSIGAIHQLAVVGADRLMGAPMNVERSVEKIGFDQAAAAMGTEAADLAMGHLAGREAGHHPIGKAQGGIDVINRAVRTAATSSSEAHHRSTRQLQHQIDVMNHQIQHH